jgi:26S proteasome regulatory subunit T5
MKSEILRINHDLTATKEKIKENTEKIKVNKTLPYLVSNVIEVSTRKLFKVSQK